MKKWWKSKTFWLNVATLGVASAIEQPNPVVLTQVMSVANIILRFLTTKAVGNQET